MVPLRIIQSITYKANIWIHWKAFKKRIFFSTGKQCITLVLPINSFSPCISLGSTRETEASRSYILRYLLQEIGLPDCGGWLGDSEIQRAGRQEGQAGNSQAWAEVVARWNFFFREASVVLLNLSPDWISLSSAFKTFQFTESGWPRQPVRITLV